MSRASKESFQIGQRIRQIRQARGLPQRIAEEIRFKYGVKLSSNYLSRMERGDTEIPLRTLFALADYLGVHPSHLIDPNTSGNPAGVDYIFTDPELVEYLIRLKHNLGEAKARQHLKILLREILVLMEEINLNQTAARPAASSTVSDGE